MGDLILRTFVAVTVALVTLVFWFIIVSIVAANFMASLVNLLY